MRDRNLDTPCDVPIPEEVQFQCPRNQEDEEGHRVLVDAAYLARLHGELMKLRAAKGGSKNEMSAAEKNKAVSRDATKSSTASVENKHATASVGNTVSVRPDCERSTHVFKPKMRVLHDRTNA